MLAGNVGQPSDFLEDQERSLSHSSTYVPKPQVSFPVEILDQIVLLALEADNYAFSAIANFSLASHQFRQIALKRALSRCNLTRQHLRWYPNIPGMSSWVRTLLCFSNISTLSKHNFSWNIFENLQELQIDLYHENLKTQTRCVKAIFSDKFFVLQILKLTEVPRIDTHLLGLISSACPGLTRLELSSVEALRRAICCWNCWQNATSLVVHSPIPSKYRCAEDLANAFSHALLPLKNLQDLYLGLFLCDEMLVSDHGMYHSEVGNTNYFVDMGDCWLCDCALGEVRNQMRNREEAASTILRDQMKCLNTVEWASAFTILY